MRKRIEASYDDQMYIYTLLCSGFTQTDVAQKTGYSVYYVGRIARLNNVGLGRGRPTAPRILNEDPNPVSYETMWAIVGCLMNGATVSSIAKEFKVDRKRVLEYAKEFGVSYEETKIARAKLQEEVGEDWRALSITTARWQPDITVV